MIKMHIIGTENIPIYVVATYIVMYDITQYQLMNSLYRYFVYYVPNIHPKHVFFNFCSIPFECTIKKALSSN